MITQQELKIACALARKAERMEYHGIEFGQAGDECWIGATDGKQMVLLGSGYDKLDASTYVIPLDYAEKIASIPTFSVDYDKIKMDLPNFAHLDGYPKLYDTWRRVNEEKCVFSVQIPTKEFVLALDLARRPLQSNAIGTKRLEKAQPVKFLVSDGVLSICNVLSPKRVIPLCEIDYSFKGYYAIDAALALPTLRSLQSYGDTMVLTLRKMRDIKASVCTVTMRNIAYVVMGLLEK